MTVGLWPCDHNMPALSELIKTYQEDCNKLL